MYQYHIGRNFRYSNLFVRRHFRLKTENLLLLHNKKFGRIESKESLGEILVNLRGNNLFRQIEKL